MAFAISKGLTDYSGGSATDSHRVPDVETSADIVILFPLMSTLFFFQENRVGLFFVARRLAFQANRFVTKWASPSPSPSQK